MTPSEQHPAGAEAASELLSRRAQIQEWLQRLDTVDDDIPPQVKRRVRADYEHRLAAVVADLAVHSESLTADREVLEERLLAAAERHDAAHDALEEVRLRHRIGEISDQEWEDRRPALESELDAAKSERESIDQEIAVLEDLLFQLGAAGAAAAQDAVEVAAHAGSPAEEATLEAPRPPETPAAVPVPDVAPVQAPAAEPAPTSPEEFAAEAEEWVPDLPEIEVPADWPPPPEPAEPVDEEAPTAEHPAAAAAAGESPIVGDHPLDVGTYTKDEERRDDDLVEITTFAAAAEALAEEVDPAPADDDYAFLEELDRAIAATAPSTEAAEPEEETSARPQPGLKCPDCGYSNDPAAWYCGVCGVDLG